MSGRVRVGTSGWQYDDWDGRFYPADVPKRRWYEHYASVFPTVEINYSFYRLPRTSTAERWNRQAPDRFRYAVKGSRYITHNLKLADPAEAIAHVVERLAPLKTFLGVWLWQLPPNLHRDVPRLGTFLGLLPAGHRHAVEFRHRSWYDDEVVATLRHHGAAWVWLSDQQMPDDAPVTGDFVYLRLHGLGSEDERYRWDYADEELAPWLERLRDAAGRGLDGFVYFNNDHHAKAPRNARRMIDLLDDAAFPWP